MAVQQVGQTNKLALAAWETWQFLQVAFWLTWGFGAFAYVLLYPFLYYSGALAEINTLYDAFWDGVDTYLRNNPVVLLGVPFVLLFAVAYPQLVKDFKAKYNIA